MQAGVISCYHMLRARRNIACQTATTGKTALLTLIGARCGAARRAMRRVNRHGGKQRRRSPTPRAARGSRVPRPVRAPGLPCGCASGPCGRGCGCGCGRGGPRPWGGGRVVDLRSSRGRAQLPRRRARFPSFYLSRARLRFRQSVSALGYPLPGSLS